MSFFYLWSSLQNCTGNNTRQYGMTQVQHEYNTTQLDATQVKHDITRVQYDKTGV